ncbi:hypothetical protein Pelo_7432 [Pelomyxa schiedti]|nr:hypothetical protein Pelo_7432 [Pelomyxa schiedti]
MEETPLQTVKEVAPPMKLPYPTTEMTTPTVVISPPSESLDTAPEPQPAPRNILTNKPLCPPRFLSSTMKFCQKPCISLKLNTKFSATNPSPIPTQNHLSTPELPTAPRTLHTTPLPAVIESQERRAAQQPLIGSTAGQTGKENNGYMEPLPGDNTEKEVIHADKPRVVATMCHPAVHLTQPMFVAEQTQSCTNPDILDKAESYSQKVEIMNKQLQENASLIQDLILRVYKLNTEVLMQNSPVFNHQIQSLQKNNERLLAELQKSQESLSILTSEPDAEMAIYPDEE